MLIIRLHRMGRKQKPFYRVVLAEKHKHVSKKFIHNFGTYDPITKALNISDKEKLQKYIDINVEISDTLRSIFEKNKVIKVDQVRKKEIERKVKEGEKKKAEELKKKKDADKATKEETVKAKEVASEEPSEEEKPQEETAESPAKEPEKTEEKAEESITKDTSEEKAEKEKSAE